MQPDLRLLDPQAPPKRTGARLPAGILRLVKGGPERQAIAAGEVDAVIDPASGKVFLLPDAQEALLERQARSASLLALAADWAWEQDEHYRFTSFAGICEGSPPPCAAIVLGKPLWELGLATQPGARWETHRQQLEWRAAFRDLELGWRDGADQMRWASIDGEPVFDAADRFRGYRGTMRDITGRERLRALVQGARDTATESQPDQPYQRPHARRDDASADPRTNALLAALPPEDRRRLEGDLKPVTLNFDDVLYAPGERMRHVYFPIDCLVSLRATVQDGLALEVGLVGREGMVGASLALGTDMSTVRAVVQRTGSALQMTAASFRRTLRDSPPLQAEAYRFVHAKLAVARQTAACARFHQVEARLAGWLLGVSERIGSAELKFTHKSLAAVLGVRRVGITHAASSLERHALISYRRGTIHLLDREGLGAASCGCYRTWMGINHRGVPAVSEASARSAGPR